jgi:hypothetical protein
MQQKCYVLSLNYIIEKKPSYANRLSCLVRIKERDILYTAGITNSIVTMFIFCKIMLNNILVNDVMPIPLINYR